MTTRVVPLLAVSAAVLALGSLMLLRGGPPRGSPQPAGSRDAGSARRPAATAARGGHARVTKHIPHVTLPVDSPWALPPMLVLQARTGGRPTAALRRRVLHLRHLALSPAARRSVRRGTASAGALKLLAAFPRTGGPLLVLALTAGTSARRRRRSG